MNPLLLATQKIGYYFIFILFLCHSMTVNANEALERAIALKKAGQPYASLRLLETIQGVNPLRLDLEKAENLLLVGQYKKARVLFLKVLRNPKIPPTVRKNTENFLNLLNKEAAMILKNKHQFSAIVKIGYGDDTNATRGPDRNSITDAIVNEFSLRDNNQQADTYRLFSVQLNSLYHFTDSLNILGQPVYISLKNTFKVKDNNYQVVNDFDFRFFQIKSKLNLKQPRNWQMGLELSHYRILRNHERYANFNGIKLNFEKSIQKFRLQLSALSTRRHYFNAPENIDLSGFRPQKTGTRHEVRIALSAPLFQHFASEIGFSRIIQNATLDNYAYNAYFTSFKNTWKITKKSYLYANFYHYKYNYKGTDLGFNPNNGDSLEIYDSFRRDRVQNLKIGGRYFLNAPFFADLQLNIVKSKANHQLHQYKQRRIEFALGFEF